MQTEVPARPPSASALDALRASTRSRHERIDRTMDLGALRDRSRYVRVLQVFEAFLSAWEPAIARCLPERTSWLQARSRRGFAQDDLRALHEPRVPTGTLDLPATAAAAWGSLYVLEGSALGGQVISRELARSGLASTYFQGWGEATGGMWREFRLLLERELASPAAIEQACQAARATFDNLNALLDSALNERTTAA